MAVIIPMRWADVPGGVRVVLSSGRVAHVLDRIPGMPALVMLRNATGHTRGVQVDPNAVVPMIFDEQETAAAVLRTAFPSIEYLREVK